jgi:REP element-mobilizing transposase RayT
MDILPCRKPNRLQGYDYSQNGAYFVTICVKDRAEILGKIQRDTVVGAIINRPSSFGEIVTTAIAQIGEHYPNVFVDCYVIMPNHIHMVIAIDGRLSDEDGRLSDDDGRLIIAPTDGNGDGRLIIAPTDGNGDGRLIIAPTISEDGRLIIALTDIAPTDIAPTISPTVSVMVKEMKSFATKQIGYSIWQRSFYDHIIRNENDYRRIAEYVENNPANWEKDRFHGGKQ